MPQARANGIDIEYESFGRDGDPLVLLIMGLAAQLVFWPEPLCEGLAAKGFRVVRFDNRDIGKSTHLAGRAAPDPRAILAVAMSGGRPNVPYTLDDMADDAVGLMDALGVDRAHVVGASMGGMIAQLVAINHPERTKSLASIMSTTGRRDLPPGNPEVLSVLFRPPKSASRDDLIEMSILVQHALASPGFPATEEEIRATAERRTDYAPYDAAGLARQSAALIAAPPRDARLKASALSRAGPSRRRRSGHTRSRGQGHRGKHPRRRADHRARHESRLRPAARSGLPQAYRRFRY